MNPTINNIGQYNEQQDMINLFRDYLFFCSDEQNTINNILHTQNLISNNRYSMFNQIMRFARPEQTNPPTWNFPTFTNTIPNRTFRTRPSRRPPPRIFQFPIRNNLTSNTTTNPLQEFINESNNQNTTRRRPTTLRQFFDSCDVFVYSDDLSNNQIHCPITMLNFETGDLCIRLPCNHIFKFRPLLQWLTTARTCPMCRRQIPSTSERTNRNNRQRNRQNASIQTTDISGGFIADISANTLDDLTDALTSTVTNRIRNIFQTTDLSSNNFAWATGISIEASNRSVSQSPLVFHGVIDASNNLV